MLGVVPTPEPGVDAALDVVGAFVGVALPALLVVAVGLSSFRDETKRNVKRMELIWNLAFQANSTPEFLPPGLLPLSAGGLLLLLLSLGLLSLLLLVGGGLLGGGLLGGGFASSLALGVFGLSSARFT